MKKSIAFLLSLFLIQQVSATTFYEQLCEFNFNWKKYEHRILEEEARIFKSDKEYIQAHLSNVINVLRSNTIDQLDADRLKSRLHLIEILDQYRIDGLFPMNYYRKERLPVFIDEHNTHCAVGHLLQQTGYEDVARRIAATNNYAWVKDIKDPAVSVWQESSGFTLEELKLIQGAYDSYMENAFFLPNRHVIPQKPEVIMAYFDNNLTGEQLEAKRENIWCYGEGKNGVLNGRWEQNYAVGIPWIVGFYENGNRTGQWKEYYQGTNLLCRTENWRNDKLNGVRKRFDRSGIIIEEIMFREGEAITKINHDFTDSLTYIRKPLDSNLVWTEIYTLGGALIASGKESIQNPGNLLWFQNIELTALNSASITSRDMSVGDQLYAGSQFGSVRLFSSPPLVNYNKEGDWTYYREFNLQHPGQSNSNGTYAMLNKNFKHFSDELFEYIYMFDDFRVGLSFDSICVSYSNDLLENLYGYRGEDYSHLHIRYYEQEEKIELNISEYYGIIHSTHPGVRRIKELGQYNMKNEQIGVWKHFNKQNVLYKTENFIIPRKEEEIVGMR